MDGEIVEREVDSLFGVEVFEIEDIYNGRIFMYIECFAQLDFRENRYNIV